MDTQSLKLTYRDARYDLVVTWRWDAPHIADAGDVEVVTIDWRDGTSQGEQEALLADRRFLADVHDALCCELADGPSRDEAGPCLSGSYTASEVE